MIYQEQTNAIPNAHVLTMKITNSKLIQIFIMLLFVFINTYDSGVPINNLLPVENMKQQECKKTTNQQTQTFKIKWEGLDKYKINNLIILSIKLNKVSIST